MTTKTTTIFIDSRAFGIIKNLIISETDSREKINRFTDSILLNFENTNPNKINGPEKATLRKIEELIL